EGTIGQWSAATGQPVAPLIRTGIENPWSTALRFDATQAAIGAFDAIYLWDVATASPAAAPLAPAHRGPVQTLAFSHNGRRLASGGPSLENNVLLWNLDTLQPQGEPLNGHLSRISDLAFNTDDSRLLSS